MPTPRRYPDRAHQQAAYRQRLAAARTQELRLKGMPPAPAIPTMPGTARWNALLQHAALCLQAARDDMQTYCNERSETWQDSERGEALTERIQLLEDAIEAVEAITG